MYLGLRVLRGPDWTSGESDRREGHLGTVALVDSGKGMVDVIWDNGQRRSCLAGKNNKHELLIFDNATVGEITPCDMNRTICCKREMVCKLLIERGADVKVYNNGKQTCVHLACWANLYKILPILIQKGCNINARDGNEDTPLHDAIQKGGNECTEILVADGNIKLTISNQKGFIALHFASLRGSAL